MKFSMIFALTVVVLTISYFGLETEAASFRNSLHRNTLHERVGKADPNEQYYETIQRLMEAGQYNEFPRHEFGLKPSKENK